MTSPRVLFTAAYVAIGGAAQVLDEHQLLSPIAAAALLIAAVVAFAALMAKYLIAAVVNAQAVLVRIETTLPLLTARVDRVEERVDGLESRERGDHRKQG